MNKIIIGIDVGTNGCLAYTNPKGEIFTNKPKDWINTLEFISFNYPNNIVYIERVWTRPGQSAYSAGKMMQNYGEIIGMLKALGFEYVEVSPQIWQKGIGHIAPKGTEYSERKKLLIERAKNDYPDIPVFAWMADGMLIMQYGILRENQQSKGWE